MNWWQIETLQMMINFGYEKTLKNCHCPKKCEEKNGREGRREARAFEKVLIPVFIIINTVQFNFFTSGRHNTPSIIHFSPLSPLFFLFLLLLSSCDYNFYHEIYQNKILQFLNCLFIFLSQEIEMFFAKILNTTILFSWCYFWLWFFPLPVR